MEKESEFILKGQDKKGLSKLPISVLQPQGPLFFGSIESLINIYITSSKHEILIVDMDYVTMIDLSGAYVLEDLINTVKAKNIEVFVSNANSHIKKILDKVNFIEHIGKEYYKDSKSSIISIILERYHLEESNFSNKEYE